MKDARKTAKELAKRGRFGDNQILHVSKAEISGIERIIGRQLPRNPDTGAKEAFFFLPFLAALAAPAAAAPIAALAPAAATAAGTAAATGAAGALGAGLASGLGAATGALGGTAAAALPTAAEIAASAAPATAAATLPAATTAATSGLASAAAPLTGLVEAGGTVPMGGFGLESLVGSAPAATGTKVAGLEIASGMSPQSAAAAQQIAQVAPTAMSPESAAAQAAMGNAGPDMTLAGPAGTPPRGLAGLGSPGRTPVITPEQAVPPTNPAYNPQTAGTGHVIHPPNATVGTPAPMAEEAATSGGGGLFAGMDLQSMMLPAMLMSQGMGGGGSDDDDSDREEAQKNVNAPYSGPKPKFPGSKYRPGKDPEHKYFNNGGLAALHNYACGGMVKKYARGGIVENPLYFGFNAQSGDDFNFDAPYAPDPDLGQGMPVEPKAPAENKQAIDLQGKIDALTQRAFEYAKADTRNGFNGPLIRANRQLEQMHSQLAGMTPAAPAGGGGTPGTSVGVPGGGGPGLPAQKVKKFAAGGMVEQQPAGIAALQTGPQPMPVNSPPMAPPKEPGTVPTSPYPKEQVGAQSPDDKELITRAVLAIKGQDPNPQATLMEFVNEFGEDALKDLVARVRNVDASAAVPDGQNDMIPASIEGQQPAALSDGEYVVPADVVAHLGNGSTRAGAQHLDQMRDRVRQAKTGKKEQPAGISALQMMPV